MATASGCGGAEFSGFSVPWLRVAVLALVRPMFFFIEVCAMAARIVPASRRRSNALSRFIAAVLVWYFILVSNAKAQPVATSIRSVEWLAAMSLQVSS